MDAKPNIYQRINAVMGEVSYVQKEQKSGMRYSIVSHDAVTGLLREPIQKHGIVYYPLNIQSSQNGNRTEVSMVVRFVSIDDPTDFADVHSLGYGIDDQDKGPGKAISYAVKYALLKTFGLETGDDPDNDQDVSHKPTSPASARAGTSARPAAQTSLETSVEGNATISVKAVRTGETNGKSWELIVTSDDEKLFNQTGEPLHEGVTYDVELKGKNIVKILEDLPF